MNLVLFLLPAEAPSGHPDIYCPFHVAEVAAICSLAFAAFVSVFFLTPHRAELVRHASEGQGGVLSVLRGKPEVVLHAPRRCLGQRCSVVAYLSSGAHAANSWLTQSFA